MMKPFMDAHNETAESISVEPVSQVYLFLSRCFSYPDSEFYEAMTNNMLNEEIGFLVEGLPFIVNYTGVFSSPSLHQDEFESEYINSFDVWLGSSPPFPLYEYFYRTGELTRRDILEELLLFYEHFKIMLNPNEKDYPDHLGTELEFMAFLRQMETASMSRGIEPYQFRIAQIDFLERHLNKWVYRFNKRIQERCKEPFYKDVSAFMVEFLNSHLLHLKTFDKRGSSDLDIPM